MQPLSLQFPVQTPKMTLGTSLSLVLIPSVDGVPYILQISPLLTPSPSYPLNTQCPLTIFLPLLRPSVAYSPRCSWRELPETHVWSNPQQEGTREQLPQLTAVAKGTSVEGEDTGTN